MPQHSIILLSPWKRVKLVPPTPDDDEEVALCRTHPTTRQYLTFLPEHMTKEEVRARRESRAEDKRIIDFYIHLVQDDGTERFAGVSGIIVTPDLHGKNLATEVFYVLLQYIFEVKKLHRVTFETAANNAEMNGWLEKIAGARLEAERKECWKGPDGSYTDVKGYAILDREWESAIKPRLNRRLGPSNS